MRDSVVDQLAIISAICLMCNKAIVVDDVMWYCKMSFSSQVLGLMNRNTCIAEAFSLIAAAVWRSRIVPAITLSLDLFPDHLPMSSAAFLNTATIGARLVTWTDVICLGKARTDDKEKSDEKSETHFWNVNRWFESKCDEQHKMSLWTNPQPFIPSETLRISNACSAI